MQFVLIIVLYSQMLKVRRMLTEILLSVTDDEVEDIAKEVYRKAKETASKGSIWSMLSSFKYFT